MSIYRSQPKSVLDLLWTELQVVMKNTDRALSFLTNPWTSVSQSLISPIQYWVH